MNTVGPTHSAVGFGSGFWQSVHSLEPIETKRVVKAVDQFCDDPLHPSLNLEKLAGRAGENRLHSVRASQELRILLAKQGGTYVMLEAGHHDDLYQRATRSRFVVSETSRFVGLVEQIEQAGQEPVEPSWTSRSTGADRPGIVDHWSDGELAEVGLRDDQIARLRGCSEIDRILDDLPDLDDEKLDLLLQLVEVSPEAWHGDQDEGEEEAESRFRSAIERFGALSGISPLFTAEEAREIASRPIEDWMVFLHPDQRRLVEESYLGPARVRGAAGTGKTVVCLHRAAELARRHADDGRVLFITVLDSLAPVLEQLYLRLPGAVGDRVDFMSIDQLALAVSGIETALIATDEEVATTFAAAFDDVVTAGSPLAEASLTPHYVREEIETVIKGKGIASLGRYLDVTRRGRLVGLTERARRHVWDVHEEWTAELLALGRLTRHDVVTAAVEEAGLGSAPRWRSAVVDEAQDLTMTALQLVSSVVSGGSDSLLLSGDGAQKIFPGGYTLRQAGIEVRGRTTVLKTNYRSTEPIIAGALAVAGADTVVDLDEDFRRGELVPDSDRSGPLPRLMVCEDPEDQIDAIGKLVAEIAADEVILTGDIAVLVSAESMVDEVTKGLAGKGLPVTPVLEYLGVTDEGVKVGTWAQSKGLEFKAVVVVGVGVEQFPDDPRDAGSSDEVAERRALELSHLFVAMTRARDTLVLSAVGQVAREVAAAKDHFEPIDCWPSHVGGTGRS